MINIFVLLFDWNDPQKNGRASTKSKSLKMVILLYGWSFHLLSPVGVEESEKSAEPLNVR